MENNKSSEKHSSSDSNKMVKGGLLVRNQSGFSTLYRMVDLSIISILYYLSSSFYNVPFGNLSVLLPLVYVIFFQLSAEAIELYRSWRGERTIEMLRAAAITWAISAVVTLTVGFFFTGYIDTPSPAILLWLASSFLSLLSWRYVMRKLLFRLRKVGMNSRNAIVIGATTLGYNVVQQIIENDQLGIRFSGLFDDRAESRLAQEFQSQINGKIESAIELAKRNEVDYIYIALPMNAEKRIRHILEKCSDTTASVYIIPNFFMYNLLNARWQSIGSVQALSVYDTPFQGASNVLKRIEDLVLGFLILSLLLAPMCIIACIVKLTSKGPIIFKQKRYGLDGKQITIYKFRSMTTQDNGAIVKQATKNDPRITKVGRILRRTSLDELPQFINVLQGRMSIVGPRPHAVAHNEEYRKLIKGYMLRHKVKPGITGWAQVNGLRGETQTVSKMAQRVEYDLEYIHRWSVWLDFKIIVMTVLNGFLNKNAY
jgi:putative colanic acid biosysnthesis UDP-glucose lipid carrier transferase